MFAHEEWTLTGLYRRPTRDDGATAPAGHSTGLCLVTSSLSPRQASTLEARNVIGHLCSPLAAHSFTSCDGQSSRAGSPEVPDLAP